MKSIKIISGKRKTVAVLALTAAGLMGFIAPTATGGGADMPSFADKLEQYAKNRLESAEPDSSADVPAIRATDFTMGPSVIQLGGYPSRFSVRILNNGEAPASELVTLTVYLSSNGIFGSANNLTMGSVERSISLASGQSVDIQLNQAERSRLRVPSGTALTYYTAFLKVTTTDQGDTNNVLTLTSSIRLITSRLVNQDDFDGDGKTDLAVYNQTTGAWTIRGSATGLDSTFVGAPGFTPVSGDFDNDGKADFAVYDESTGTWVVYLSESLFNAVTTTLGGPGFNPVAGDFDGDGKADPAVYNSSTGQWIVLLSGSSYATAVTFLGGAGALSVAGDYDGDGKADPAVYLAKSRRFTSLLSGSNYALISRILGGEGCVPITGDFDCDNISDTATYQENIGLWTVMLSGNYNSITTSRFGETGFKQVSGDFDGDGKTDMTVYQIDYNNWYFRLSRTGYPLSSLRFGGTGFKPIGINW